VSYAALCGVLAWVFGIPGLVLSWYAALLYIPIARDALRAGRSRRAAETGVGSTG